MSTTQDRPVEDWTLVDAIESEPTPLAQLRRAEICAAIRAAAEKHHGVVNAGTVREFLPEGVNPHLIGNVMRSLRKRRAIQWTGRYVPSGNAKSRNNLKPVHEWYVPAVEAVK